MNVADDGVRRQSILAVVDTGCPYLLIAEQRCSSMCPDHGGKIQLGLDPTHSVDIPFNTQKDKVNFSRSVYCQLRDVHNVTTDIDIVVGAVTRRSSKSMSFNVFGVSGVNMDHVVKNCLVHQLRPHVATHCIGFSLCTTSPIFTFGCIPLDIRRKLHAESSVDILLDPKSPVVNTYTDRVHSFSASYTNTFKVVFDTGTNITILPSSILKHECGNDIYIDLHNLSLKIHVTEKNYSVDDKTIIVGTDILSTLKCFEIYRQPPMMKLYM